MKEKVFYDTLIIISLILIIMNLISANYIAIIFNVLCIIFSLSGLSVVEDN